MRIREREKEREREREREMSDTDTIVQRSVRGPQVYDTHKYACMIHIHTYMRVKMWPAGLQIMYPNLHIEMYIYSPQSTS